MKYIYGRGHYYGPFKTKKEAVKAFQDCPGAPLAIEGYKPEEGWKICDGFNEYCHPASSAMGRPKEELDWFVKEFPNGYHLITADFGGDASISAFMNDWGANDDKDRGMLFGTVGDDWLNSGPPDYTSTKISGPKVAYFYWSSKDDCNALFVEKGRYEEFKAVLKDWFEHESRGINEILTGGILA